MLVGKQKPAFRLKITDVNTEKSKTVTIYQGTEKKTLEQVLSGIIQYLRKKD